MAQNALPDEVKRFVVQQLACWDTPSEVAKAVNEVFQIEISRQAVERYDPNKRMGEALSEGLRELFDATRKAFLEDTASIGISHRTVRLRALARMAERAEGMKNFPLAAQLHEQAAKEMGNAYTNRREITGANGGAVQVISSAMTPKEAADAYAGTLHGDGG